MFETSYSIRQINLDDDRENLIYELVSNSSEDSKSPFKSFCSKKGNRESKILLLRVLVRINLIGISIARKTQVIKHLKEELYEIRVKGATIRAYCFTEDEIEKLVIVGIEGETHKGSGNAHRLIDKYLPLARQAKELLGAENEEKR